MRRLCNTVVERRFGAESPSTMIMKTALDLWQDPLLVNALQNNATYRSARERISRTAGHIRPHVGEGAPDTLQTRAILHSTQQAITSPLQQVLQCNVCGLKLHCLHTHKSSDGTAPAIIPMDNDQTYDREIEEQVEEFKNFTEGTVGRVPEAMIQEYSSLDGKAATPPATPLEQAEEGNSTMNWDLWFGPLVLATFATFGLVFGVWSGDISIPRLKNLTSRAVIAISAVMRVSDNLDIARM
jgi:hypothetical protein